MGYHFNDNEPVNAGVKRMAREQIDSAIAEIDDHELDRHEAVHQVRKRCKKIRALLRIVRPQFEHTYQEENDWYRNAARSISDVRDTQSQIECYDELMEHFGDQVDRPQLATVRRALTHRRNQVTHIDERLARFRQAMEEGRERIAAWPLEGEEFDALAGGLGKTYRRGRRAMHDAYANPSPESFHEWRKRVKYHWYHFRVIRDAWERVLKRHRNEIHRLGGYLGDDHDLAILRHSLTEGPDEFGQLSDVQAMVGLIDRRRTELQTQARPLGDRVFAEKRGLLLDRLQSYWQAWRRETATTAALVDDPAVVAI